MDNEKKEQQEEVKEGVTKAFGNEEPAKETADPKAADANQEQEGTESASEDKKQSGKTYTQAEVDAMMAKARKKYSKNESQEEAPSDTTDAPKEDPLQTQDLATGITIERLAQAELKAEMAISGVDPSKVSRAVRLIDINEVLDNGEYSDAKAKTVIETLMKEWPELKQSKADTNENQFYFGVPGQEEQQDKDKQKSVISSIFGN